MRIGSMIDLLYKSLNRFCSTRYSWAAVIALSLAILKNGIGYVDFDTYRLVAEDPFTRVPTQWNFFQASPLTPLIAYYLGLTSRTSFGGLTLVMLGAAYLVLLLSGRKTLGPGLGAVLFAIVLSHPLTVVLHTWLGMPDQLTLLFLLIAVFATDSRLLFLISFLGVVNHPLTAFAVPAVLLLRLSGRAPNIRLKVLGVSLLGVILGAILANTYLRVHGIDVAGRLNYIEEMGPAFWITMNLSNLPYLIFSLNGPVWILVLLLPAMYYARDRKFFLCYALITTASFGITFFTLDNSRVFGLLTIGPTIYMVIHSIALAADDQRDGGLEEFAKALTVLAIVFMLFPNYYTWEGRVQNTSFSEFFLSILSHASRLLAID